MAEYNQPKPVPVPNTAGYPNNTTNTQTKVKRRYWCSYTW